MPKPKAAKAWNDLSDFHATSEAIRRFSIAKRAKRWHVSQTTAAAIIEPSKPHVLGSAAWKVKGLDKRLAKSMQRNLEGRRCRPAKSTERIFHEAANTTPDWYLDASLPLPAALQSLLNR